MALALALALAGCATPDGASVTFPPAEPTDPSKEEPLPCATSDRGPTLPFTADEIAIFTRGLDALHPEDRRPFLKLAAGSIVARADETFASVDAWIAATHYDYNQTEFAFAGNRTDGGVTRAIATFANGTPIERAWTRVDDVYLGGTPLIDDAHAIAAKNGTATNRSTSGEQLVSWSPDDPGCLTIRYRTMQPHTCSDGVCVTPGYTTHAIAKVDLGAAEVVSWS